jgi:hypothetical protein
MEKGERRLRKKKEINKKKRIREGEWGKREEKGGVLL